MNVLQDLVPGCNKVIGKALVPRKWLMPNRQITVKDFKTLLRRRSRALSRLPNDNPNPKPNATTYNHNDRNNRIGDAINNGGSEAKHRILLLEEPKGKDDDRGEGNLDDKAGGEMGSEGGGGVEKTRVNVLDSAAIEAKPDVDRHHVALQKELNVVEEANKVEEEKSVDEDAVNRDSQIVNKEVGESFEVTRKKDVEERLKVLNGKKHNLVQVLKLIQNAEEELKRRSNTQGVIVRPTLPLQVEIPTDIGSITRVNTPRMGSDGILGTEVERGEPDGSLNRNTDTRLLLRITSTSPSPSSDSQHKKPAYNVVPHSARATGVSASPSRFAPTGPQGQASNLPTVSVSGTNYVASSPSPAASGGTSVFRENMIPSPRS